MGFCFVFQDLWLWQGIGRKICKQLIWGASLVQPQLDLQCLLNIPSFIWSPYAINFLSVFFGKSPKTNSFSLECGGDLSYFAEMAKVIRCELPGFPPFTSVFLLQSLPGSCSIKYLPDSTLFFHAWGESSFSTLFTFSALILSPFTCGRFLERKVYTGPPCPHLPLHSLLHYSTLLPLFTNHSLKLRSNVLITRWSMISSQLFSLWHTHLSPCEGIGNFSPRFSLWNSFFPWIQEHTYSLSDLSSSVSVGRTSSPSPLHVGIFQYSFPQSSVSSFPSWSAPTASTTTSLPLTPQYAFLFQAMHLTFQQNICHVHFYVVSPFTAQLPHLSVPNSFSHLTILQVSGQNFSHLWLLLCHL